MSIALVLAGHGSHISPNTAGVVWEYVDLLRAWGVADEVTACFWKEVPSFSRVFDAVVADEIVVVPVFTAQGYFTQTVIPAEMRLDGSVTEHEGRKIHYARTLGEHPYLAQIVQQRVVETMANARLYPQDVAVAIIGHGTPRNRSSRHATRQQAEELRSKNLVAEVVAVYLDDEPCIPNIYRLTHSPNIIAVPFFLAPGSHVSDDVPRALGLANGQYEANRHGRRVYYTAPVGTDESIAELILELARATGMPLMRTWHDDIWAHFPTAGRDEFVSEVLRSGELIFGQLRLTPEEVCPVDRESCAREFKSPAQLRSHVRDDPFRPLATTDDLPRDWFVRVTAPDMLHSVVETVYPGAVADWAANRQSHIACVPLVETLKRQSGMFQGLAQLSENSIDQIVSDVCGCCIRHPTWRNGITSSEYIPCNEVCNLWMTIAKEYVE